jgi:pimeloyl-ACP methyl ester carboxylesterase
MPFLNLPEVKVHYLQLPNAEATSAKNLVMVHGLAANLAFWYLHVAPAFTTDFSVTLFDLRGHGRSGQPPSGYTPAAMAEDLRLLADALELERFSVMAHSFGGLVALHVLRAYPHRIDRIVLADTHLGAFRSRQALRNWPRGLELEARFAAEGIRLNLGETDFGLMLLEILARLHVDHPERVRRFDDLLSPFMGQGARRSAMRWLNLLDHTSARTDIYLDDGLSLKSLRHLCVPTLALYGARSHALASGKALAGIWPHCRFEIVPDAGHFFPVSKPDALIQPALCFLKGDV